METIAGEYQMDWRLLAAMAYQESHWDPRCPIPYGGSGHDDAHKSDRQ